MEKNISIAQFIKVIKQLPEDEPIDKPGVWYRTQREHWLRWLAEYDTAGAYGRIPGQKRDARYAYNHIVNPQLLLYLVRAIPLRAELVKAAERAGRKHGTMMGKAGAIRGV